jgi:hypothetical protein
VLHGVAGRPRLIDDARTFCFTFLLRCEEVPALFNKFRERHVVDEKDSVDLCSALPLLADTSLIQFVRQY